MSAIIPDMLDYSLTVFVYISLAVFSVSILSMIFKGIYIYLGFGTEQLF